MRFTQIRFGHSKQPWDFSDACFTIKQLTDQSKNCVHFTIVKAQFFAKIIPVNMALNGQKALEQQFAY